MNDCTEYKEMLSRYLDSELPEEEVRRLKEHIASCDECTRLLRRWQRNDELAADAPEVNEERWGELWRRLERHVPQREEPIIHRVWPVVTAAALAAGVLVAAYFFAPTVEQEPQPAGGTFEVISIELSDPAYTVAVTSSDGPAPVIWLEEI